jgi:hypothetical protein
MLNKPNMPFYVSSLAKIAIGLPIVAGFFLAMASFRLLILGHVSYIVNNYAPPVSPLGEYLTKKDPAISTLAPKSFQRMKFPAIVSVQTDCLSCSVGAYNLAKTAFESKGLTIAIADNSGTYNTLITSHPTTPVVTVSREDTLKLNTMPSGRLYAYDASKRLIYIQNFKETFANALRKCRALTNLE